ncbi:hypothetical protein [Saccharothrix coeruleofusca]|uniref:Subtilisin inhibitor-like n=1 Tax=Saccharothrix coeruleofusca TaxID=33919 RepID=A0A918ATP2_9PSEU|nr:hypothetical protein [Saccharothrix coeruleofusca]GGP86633.1 hypothetical protein GCM10010185_70500 [Saccharothrix coeruleofusca]
MKTLLVVLLTLVAGCSTTVAGAGSGTGAATTTASTTATATTAETERTTTSESPEPVPVELPTIDESAPARYCDRPFAGALGKPMLAVVVETPSGRLDCDEAAAVLVDYYAQRRDPVPGLPPLAIGPMTCNQVPEPALPQVVCSDGDDVIYAMWPQT